MSVSCYIVAAHQCQHGHIVIQGIPSLFQSVKFNFLMTFIDSSNDQNVCIELFKATFSH